MTAPVVNVRATRTLFASSLPLVGRVLPRPKAQAFGSGVIIDRAGLVLTNAHIVDQAERVTISLGDEDLPARVVGRDKQLDVAILQIDGVETNRLPVARLGSSSSLRVGDWVVAVGNPYGLQHTVTSGIVSADERVLPGAMRAPLIQTDASINPGNSGGPLYDLDGRVVGINTAMVAGAHGIGFAVPIDLVRRAVPQLKAHGKVTRGSIGIALSGARARRSALGVEVASVTEGGPGARAGILPGDRIVRWGDERVSSPEVLPWLIALTPPGTLVRVGVLRGGQTHALRVRVALLADEGPASEW
jgi:serine protease Do